MNDEYVNEAENVRFDGQTPPPQQNGHVILENFSNDSKGPSDLYEASIRAIPIRFAGFWMRFWAYLVDLIVIGSLERIIINPVFRFFDLSLAEPSMFAPISVATAVLFYGYFVLMTKFFGQTLGKMVFGLHVVTIDGKTLSWSTILLREWIGRFISATIVIGYIIVAFLPKKQGLHDLFVDTTVIHKN
jgi:uncharacterized RDD family membrane protein YckC